MIIFANLTHSRIYIQRTYTTSWILIETFLPGLIIISPLPKKSFWDTMVLSLSCRHGDCLALQITWKILIQSIWYFWQAAKLASEGPWSEYLKFYMSSTCHFVIIFGMHLDDVMGYDTIKAPTDRYRGLSRMAVGAWAVGRLNTKI